MSELKQVYVAEVCIGDNGFDVVGVFSSVESAEAYIKDYLESHIEDHMDESDYGSYIKPFILF